MLQSKLTVHHVRLVDNYIAIRCSLTEICDHCC
ncbi:hypothetical protein AGR7B_pAt0326 [Agrobacterium deltaense RV3]|nr:hypothetical protein AGR7B_pAt0326 [Agrobacterium deltaense RV3]